MPRQIATALKALAAVLHVVLISLGVLMAITIILGLTGVLDDDPVQVEFNHRVSMERHHVKPESWVVIWTIDEHWFIQHPEGFLHHPGCPLESTSQP